MHSDIFQVQFPQSSDQTPTRTCTPVNTSKLDKMQAKRLKMPKRNRSAYFLFSMDTRAKLKTELNSQLSPLEIQIKISQLWRELSANERKRYQVKAREEKIEYLIAINKFYSSLTPETIEKSKINRPKKPCSAYAHFVRDTKLILKKESPKLIMQEILHIVSEKWRNLPQHEKLKYEEKARIDKEQYMLVTGRVSDLNQHPLKTKFQRYQKTAKPVKKFKQSSKECSTEDQYIQKIKIEQLPLKLEELPKVEVFTFTDAKFEDDEQAPSTKNSSLTFKIDYENVNQAQNMFSKEQIYKSEPLPFSGNFEYSKTTRYVNDFAFSSHYRAEFNISHSNDINFYQKRLKEIMVTNLSWLKLAQSHKEMQEAIGRKVAEVESLQAQRLMLAKSFLIASNLDTFGEKL